MAGRPRTRWLRPARTFVAVLALALALVYVVRVAEGDALARTLRRAADQPLALTLALLGYGLAFAVRAEVWRAVLPGLRRSQAWAALHVSLLGNHVLPLRLGEALRVTDVLRRTDLDPRAVTASAVSLRLADVLAVGALAAVSAPRLVDGLVGPVAAAALGVALVAATLAALLWTRRLARRGQAVRVPGVVAWVGVGSAWLLESVVMWQAAQWAGIDLSPGDAVAVTAVTIAAQTVALAPGGLGSYEAAATAALVALGAAEGPAFAAALTAHGLKTAYALVVGAVALVTPAPGVLGRWRLPRALPPRPTAVRPHPAAPVVVFLPAHDEEAVVGEVVARVPSQSCGHPVVVLVVDDGSTDATAERAAAAGARVVGGPPNRGLGAAVRRGLAEAVALSPAAVVYVDADGEYAPEELEALVAPVLAGEADYVVGSRFAGTIDVMRPHRRVGNQVLTAWVRWMTRLPVTDGQSGYRAFSPAAAAAAEVVHDYNYAQVLTLDLVAKGFRYAEVPISYSFRETGTSFIRLGRYLRKVIPAVRRELNESG